MSYSAGLLMYRGEYPKIEVFLCHPGGPFFANKNKGHWGIPKGKVENKETKISAAIREFEEETGVKVPVNAEFISLDETQQNKHKIVKAWAFYNDIGNVKIESNTFDLEYPPKSGKYVKCPELDDGRFFAISDAYDFIRPKQGVFIDRLIEILKKEYAKAR